MILSAITNLKLSKLAMADASSGDPDGESSTGRLVNRCDIAAAHGQTVVTSNGAASGRSGRGPTAAAAGVPQRRASRPGPLDPLRDRSGSRWSRQTVRHQAGQMGVRRPASRPGPLDDGPPPCRNRRAGCGPPLRPDGRALLSSRRHPSCARIPCLFSTGQTPGPHEPGVVCPRDDTRPALRHTRRARRRARDANTGGATARGATRGRCNAGAQAKQAKDTVQPQRSGTGRVPISLRRMRATRAVQRGRSHAGGQTRSVPQSGAVPQSGGRAWSKCEVSSSAMGGGL